MPRSRPVPGASAEETDLAGLQLSACVCRAVAQRDQSGAVYETTTNLWNDYHASCSVSRLNALMLALPFWWRLMQCFRVFSATGEQRRSSRGAPCPLRPQRTASPP